VDQFEYLFMTHFGHGAILDPSGKSMADQSAYLEAQMGEKV
jgi:hypothetical protein